MEITLAHARMSSLRLRRFTPFRVTASMCEDSENLGRPSLTGQQPRIDALSLERRCPPLVRRRIEQYAGLRLRREPTVAGHLLVELALAPAGIAERNDPALRPHPFGDSLQH